MIRMLASLGLTLICAAGAAADMKTKVAFAIAPQQLPSALLKYSEQSGIQVTCQGEIVEGKMTTGVTGTLDARGALDKLLQGTNLRYEVIDARTITIRSAIPRAPDARNNKVLETGALVSRDGAWLRVAQVDTERQQARGYSGEKQEQTEAADDKGIPEVLVKGSKVLNMDIKRTEDDARPYVVFDRETIARSGASNLQEFLKNRLTMGTSSTSDAEAPASSTGNASSINLRGLGTDETLILIDGRRLPAYTVYGASGQPDLNGIPLSAIERIEVLPGTASGIYGGSATGGAVNVIMRRDYAGLETTVTYGNTFDTDVARRRVEVSGGFNFGAKTNLMLMASYSDAEALLTQDRDYQMRMREHVFRTNFATYLTGLPQASPLLGATTNIRSANGSNLTLKSNPSISVGSAYTYVPYNYAGPASDGGLAFVANAGKYNIDLADNAAYGSGQGRRLAILNAPTVKAGGATLRHEFSPKFTVFSELSVSQNIGNYHRSPLFWNILVRGSDPGNPFNQDIRVTTPSPGTDIQDDTKLSTYRVAAGAIAKLGSWSAGLDFTQGRTRLTNVMIGRAYANGVGAAIGNGTLQVFRDINVYPQDFTPYVMPRMTLTPTDTTLQDVSLRFSGPAPSFLALPGGAPTLSTMFEHRRERFGEQYRNYPTRLNPLSIQWSRYPERGQDVNSVYVEALLPLVSEKNHVPGIHLLELQVTGRHDRYETSGAASQFAIDVIPTGEPQRFMHKVNSTDPTLALRYQPVEDITVRMSYGTGFLPPSAGQIVAPPGFRDDYGGYLLDPLRGGEPINEVDFLGNGAGEALKPERSESWSAGLVLAPRFIEGLRFSVDWVRIQKTDAIASVLSYSDDDFANEPYVPGLVVRGPKLPGDPASWAGPVIAFNMGVFNVGTSDMQAYDFAIDYLLDTARAGEFDFVLGATRLVTLQTQISPISPSVEYAGVGPAATTINNSDAGGLKWRTNATLTWRKNALTLGWSVRYFDGYFLNINHTVDPGQGSATIPSQVYNDIFGSYKFSGGSLARFLPGESELMFAVNNVLNKEPPLDVVGLGFAAPGYSYFGDPRKANYSLSFKTNFGGR